MQTNTARLKKDAPHKAVVLIKTEIMECLPTGEVTGIPVAKDSKILMIFGKDFEECCKKTAEIINNISNREIDKDIDKEIDEDEK